METIVVGVDIGSTMTKVIVYTNKILSSIIEHTGAEHRRLANSVVMEALAKASLDISDIDYIVATGYGRMNVPFADKQITEISCHARGISSIFPSARTVIDIGGQDCKGIKLKNGQASDFVMNDKCAAGTGRFLEVMADVLGVKLEQMGELSLRSTKELKISSTCTIFAEQEVTFHIADGAAIEDIIAGIHKAIASRICGMLGRLKIESDVVVTGGGAKNIGLVKALELKLGTEILVPFEPLLSGALGAALFAKELSLKAIEKGLPPKKKHVLEETTFFS